MVAGGVWLGSEAGRAEKVVMAGRAGAVVVEAGRAGRVVEAGWAGMGVEAGRAMEIDGVRCVDCSDRWDGVNGRIGSSSVAPPRDEPPGVAVADAGGLWSSPSVAATDRRNSAT